MVPASWQGLLQLLAGIPAQLMAQHAHCTLGSMKTFSIEIPYAKWKGPSLFHLQFYTVGQRKNSQNPPDQATQVKKAFISAGSVTTWEILLMALNRNAVNAHRVAVR